MGQKRLSATLSTFAGSAKKIASWCWIASLGTIHSQNILQKSVLLLVVFREKFSNDNTPCCDYDSRITSPHTFH